MKKYISSLIGIIIILTTLAADDVFGKYSGGTGDPNTPYQIGTKADLLALATDTGDYGKCFILTADVNMEGQVFTTAIIATDPGGGSDFEGTIFTGTFDGNSHKITQFTINGGGNSYLGLFGYIGSGSQIRNLSLENCTVSGSSLSDFAGGLVGYNYGGSISNCYSTGVVSGSSSFVGGLVGRNENGSSIRDCYSTGTVSGSGYVGGLVGFNYYGGISISQCYSMGTVSGAGDVGGLVGHSDSGSISDCYSTGTVGGINQVGGLVGFNDEDSSISQCYSTGSVSGSGDFIVGGLVGANSGSISNCYSTGTISGSEYVGGLVAYNWGGSVSDCYSMGAVSGSSYVGGLTGINDGGSVVSSFWDKDTSGQTTSDGGTGKTTVEMKTLSTFTAASWDFVEIWDIGENQTYPYLRVYPAGDINHNGIVNMADFAIFADHWLEGTAP